MTRNRRIVLNIVATYGRSLYTIVIGLFCGRWTLMALGEVDYGLYGLIAGLTVFISFFNSLMATAIGRFFAYSIGHAEKTGGEGLEDSRRWFNVAIVLHTIPPIIFLAIGYPLGTWAIHNFLAIPVSRVQDCILVWRFVCASCFLMMVSVPFNAIYTAKQYIAELTVYSFITATANFFFLYYMVSHPGVWLVKLAFWACLLAIMPQMIISARAFWLFDECRIVPSYMKDFGRMKEVAVYAFYRFFGALGIMLRKQGIDILVNKFLGPQKNAAITVAGTVSGHTNSLSSSFLTALSPAIANACGAGDQERMRKLTYATCKFSAIFVAVFALPLILEADQVFQIWLSVPPEGSVEICIGLLVILILENLSSGHYMAIFSEGNIKSYQISCLCASLVALPIIALLLILGKGVSSIVYGLLATQILIVGIRLFFGKRICGLSIRKWVFDIAGPVVVVSVLALSSGWLSKSFLMPTFGRIIMTTMCTLFVFLPLGWMVVLDKYEKNLARERVFNPVLAKFRH